VIELAEPSGRVVEVPTWQPTGHPYVEAVYEFLRRLGTVPDDRAPDYVGPYDWDWRPPGFERSQ